MKLSDRKIESLAAKVVAWLQASREVELLVSNEDIQSAVIEEFLDEKELERRLDEDVDRIIQENEARMRLEGVDPWVMRKKVRQQLARERGLVL